MFDREKAANSRFNDIISSEVEIKQVSEPTGSALKDFSEAVEAAADKYGVRVICFGSVDTDKRAITEATVLVHNVTDRTLMTFGHAVLGEDSLRMGIDMAVQAMKEAREGEA